MSHITVHSLCKEYRISRHTKGFWRSFRSIFYRDYTVKKALNNISFSIAPGELVGYIGPNGAGKSTTVKILSGILTPESGEVSVLGKTPWNHRIETARQLGVVFGQRTQLWWDLPVIESYELLKDIYDLSDIAYKTAFEALVDALQLSKLLPIPVRQLSLGQRMRCDIAASLLHSPQILFLDEPTIGLDAVSKLAVRNFIQRLNRDRKVTIMLTTHDMDDIESLCSRVLILNEGKLFLDGTLQEVRKKISPERHLIVDLLNEYDSIRDPQATFVRQEGHRAWLKFNPSEIKPPELISRVLATHSIRDLYIENPSIESIIAELYRSSNL